MIEALCIKTCYDSEAGIVYERDHVYQIDEVRFAVAPRDVNVDQRGAARAEGKTIPNGLIKHFKPKYELPPAVAERVEAQAHGERAKPRKGRIYSTAK